MVIQYLLNQALENENIREIGIVVKILKEFEKITQIKFELLHKELMEKPKKGLKAKQIFDNMNQNSKKEFEKRYGEFSNFFFKCEIEYHTLKGKTKHLMAKKYLSLFDMEYL